MLKRLIKRGSIDISHLKLYWDTEKKQIRHKAHCEYCKTEIGCMCYDTVFEAIESVEEQSFLCNKCWIKDNLDRSLTLDDLICHISDETASKVLKFVLENMTEKDMKEVISYISNMPEYDSVEEFYGRPCKI